MQTGAHAHQPREASSAARAALPSTVPTIVCMTVCFRVLRVCIGISCAPAQGGQQRGQRGAAQHRADDAPGAARAAAAPAAHRRAQRAVRAAEPKAGGPLHARQISSLLSLDLFDADCITSCALWLHEAKVVAYLVQARPC